MRLKIDGTQNASDGPAVDRVYDALRHCLPGQVLTGPVGHVQPSGDRLQTRKLHDPCPLQGGKVVRVYPNGPVPPSARPPHVLHRAGRCARSWRDRIPSDRPLHRFAGRRRPPERCEHGESETMTATGNGRPVAGRRHPPLRAPDHGVFDHASGHLRVPPKIPRPPSGTVRSICCITFDREH